MEKALIYNVNALINHSIKHYNENVLINHFILICRKDYFNALAADLSLVSSRNRQLIRVAKC